jgi:type II secretory pathway pseudopilin PulG
MNTKIRNTRFTLIELLFVIAIILVLLSMLMPAFRQLKEKAKDALCVSNTKQFGIATNQAALQGKFDNNSWGKGSMPWGVPNTGYTMVSGVQRGNGARNRGNELLFDPWTAPFGFVGIGSLRLVRNN